jgi:hypothetical protein
VATESHEWDSDLRIRSILSRTFTILILNVLPFGALALMATGLFQLVVAAVANALGVPAELISDIDVGQAFEIIFPPRGSNPNIWTLPVAMVVVPALYFTTWQIATIAICRGTFEHLTDRPTDPIANLLFSLKVLMPALIVILAIMFISTVAAAGVWCAFFLTYATLAAAGAEKYI